MNQKHHNTNWYVEKQGESVLLEYFNLSVPASPILHSCPQERSCNPESWKYGGN
jgi:hypothetical protein